MKISKFGASSVALCTATAVVGAFFATTLTAQEVTDAPTDQPTILRTQSNGYFPTEEELPTLPFNRERRAGGGVQGPDTVNPTASEFAPVYDPEGRRGLNRLRNYEAVDSFASFFEPHQSMTWESEFLQESSAVIDGNWPLFSRAYNPAFTEAKFGPFFLDLLYIGAGAIYTDYDGEQGSFGEDNEDGLIGIIEMAMRGYVKLGDSLYLSASAAFAYLPLENEFGFNTATAFDGGPNLFAGLQYETNIGAWDIVIFDRFRSGYGFFDLFASEGQDAFDRAGRYSFGVRGGDGPRGFFDSDNVYFSNVVGMNANTLFFRDDLRLNFVASHRDSWRTFGFDDHQRFDFGEVELGYEGGRLPFSPSVFYNISSTDGFDTYTQRVGSRVRGRLTDYITYQGFISYATSTRANAADNTLLWGGTIYHRLTERTRHSVSFGEDMISDNVTSDEVISRFVTYEIEHRVSRRSMALAGVTFADEEYLNRSTQSRRDRVTIFAQADYRLFSHTRLFARGAYEERDFFENGRRELWIGRIGVTHWLAPQVSLQGFYQYENNRGVGGPDFDEHAVGAMIRRWF